MRKPLLLLLMLSAVLPLCARRQRTGPARLHPAASTVQAPPASDTIVPAEGTVRLSGYDKPNAANRETFFVTNLLPDSAELLSLKVTLTYSDMSGRMLHRAAHMVRTAVPAGETRNVSVAAWDRNHSFHYFRSEAPARRASTPFKVEARVDSIVICK